jgi:hypothetical protein
VHPEDGRPGRRPAGVTTRFPGRGLRVA